MHVGSCEECVCVCVFFYYVCAVLQEKVCVCVSEGEMGSVKVSAHQVLNIRRKVIKYMCSNIV